MSEREVSTPGGLRSVTNLSIEVMTCFPIQGSGAARDGCAGQFRSLGMSEPPPRIQPRLVPPSGFDA